MIKEKTMRIQQRIKDCCLALGLMMVCLTGSVEAKTYFVHPDHLGTPQVITDAQQDVVWKAVYDPFGQATVTTETITNNLRFPGQYYDEETGLHYNGARYYDPEIGRFISSDPTGLEDGVNIYGYVAANPIRYFDPDGQAAQAAILCFIPGIGQVSCAAAAVFGGAFICALNPQACADFIRDLCPDFSSPFFNKDGDETPPARERDLPVPGKPDADSSGPPLSVDDAVDIVKGGGDVIAKDKDTARDIARKAGKGAPPVRDNGHRGGKPHYHPNGRPGGHVFY